MKIKVNKWAKAVDEGQTSIFVAAGEFEQWDCYNCGEKDEMAKTASPQIAHILQEQKGMDVAMEVLVVVEEEEDVEEEPLQGPMQQSPNHQKLESLIQK
eukprot:5598092-Ditylum_brightwellii.AAC.1